MALEITTDGGSTTELYLFRDFPPGAGHTVNITTRFDHLLTEDERTGWTDHGDGDSEPREYPPAMMSVEYWFRAADVGVEAGEESDTAAETMEGQA